MTDEELEMENKRLLSIEEGKKKYEIEKAKKDGFDVDEYGNVIPFANPTIGASLLGGSVAGIEQDDNGDITINPEKFLIGAVGGGAFYKSASSIAKNYKNNPYFKRKIDTTIKTVAKESTQTAERLVSKLTEKYPHLNINPKIIQDVKAKEWHKDNQGFYSVLEKTIDEKVSGKIDSHSLKSMLEKNGVKQDELERLHGQG